MRTELEMLNYQINPHFLFNTLNSIRELVISAPEDGARMIDALAAFCRASLVNRSGAGTTVAEEFAHAKSYLRIQKIRFGKRLQVEIDAESRVRQASIPAFIIQPLVENAVKFGQKSGARPLRVKVHAFTESGSLVIKVANTGRWFDPDREHTGTGTRLGHENIRRRLAGCYGKNAGLEVHVDEGWVTVTVSLPLADGPDFGGELGESIDQNRRTLS